MDPWSRSMWDTTSIYMREILIEIHWIWITKRFKNSAVDWWWNALKYSLQPECNILKNLTSEQYKQIRGGMIKWDSPLNILFSFLHINAVSFLYLRRHFKMSSRCILATDMARHNEILNKFKMLQPVFDFNNKEHKEVVRKQPHKEHNHF